MGKRHFKGNNRSDDKRRRQETEEKWRNTRRQPQAAPVCSNLKFEAFYKAQSFVSEGEDWDNFLQCLRSPLPACFRLNSDYEFSSELRKQLESIVKNAISIDNDLKPLTEMEWYPSGNAFKLGTDRRMIRKSKALEPLHKWMMLHTDCGNITRQEAVSMVPPIALDVQPHHKCIDMCAAPGSKTSQLLEIVGRSWSLPEDQQGLVVANDSDTDRAYMLVHQCRRINSPFLIITTHKGQEFPRIDTFKENENDNINEDQGGGGASAVRQRIRDGYFDRVLCDVPCSGDGTIRKSPYLWTKWSLGGGIALHPLQLMIAKRGFDMLKTDGLMVYSTCSMSPYENESVVAELLRYAR
eukprot:gene4338-8632_t